MPKFNIRLAHELDIAWIIALWIAIHDGDPSPIEVSLDGRTAALADEFAGYLTQALKPEQQYRTAGELQTRMEKLGLAVSIHESEVPIEGAALEELPIVAPRNPNEPPGCCVRIGNRMVCVHLQAVKH